MCKFQKIFLTFLIFFILLIPTIYADNMVNTEFTNTDSYSNTTSNFNETSVNSNVVSQNSTTSSSSNSNSRYSNTASSTKSNSHSTVSYITELPESSLGLTNILNIFLIVIGILLILLSIAILIKSK